MSESFQKAVEEVKMLPKKPNTTELGHLYGLYKQAIVGDVNIEPPGTFEFTEKAKWNAWNSHKGQTKEEAMAAYVELVDNLKAKYGN